MTTIIHCADLHLTTGEDRDYSFCVLDEVLSLTRDNHADWLLICGDLFDSFDDAEALRVEFRDRLVRAGLEGKGILLPGNHEDLRRGVRDFSALDLGPVHRAGRKPFDLVPGGDVEFLCIPHQDDYRSYIDPISWRVPPKTARFRVALFHGLVCGMGVYPGPELERAGTIDADLFMRFQVDYAAGGHIHSRLARRFGSTEVSYPGSARVWRSGETGERAVLLLHLGDTIRSDPLLLDSAGRFREYQLPIEFDGSLDGLDALAREWQPEDWVVLRLSGIVEDEKLAVGLQESIECDHKRRVRKLLVDRDDVRPVPGILSQPIARTFLEVWKRRRPDPSDDGATRAWLLARQLGLREIQTALEARAC